MKFIFIFLILNLIAVSSQAKIRLRKVKEAPKTCGIMKEELFLSRPEKKIFGTEKNSIVINHQISLIGDLGQKQCVWSAEQFLILGDLKKISFYIDEYKNLLFAYAKSVSINQKSVEQKINSNQKFIQQVQINIDRCQFDEMKTLTAVHFPKCDPPKKHKKIRRKKTA